MYILRDNSGCRIYKPSWNGTRTVIRPLPVIDPETGQWTPGRRSDAPRDLGDWIRSYPVAFGIGMQGVTFIVKDPRDDTFDVSQSPAALLYRAIPAAVKAGQAPPAWSPLLFGRDGRGAALTPIKPGYLIQCILMEHKSKPFNPPMGSRPDDPVVVMLLTQSAGEALLAKLEERNANGDLRHPDVVDLKHGAFLQFHQTGTQGPQLPMGSGTQQKVELSYDVDIYDSYLNIPADITGLGEMLARKVKAWDDIVHVPTLEEQVRKLCHCGIPASALVYALGETYGAMIPDDIREQAYTTQPQQQTGWGQPAQPPQPAASGGWGAQRAATADATMPSAQTVAAATAAPPTQAEPPANAWTAPVAAQSAPPAPQTVAAAAQAEGYDAPPANTDPGRSRATMDALDRARQRAARARGQ
jgi:hypothetical protein